MAKTVEDRVLDLVTEGDMGTLRLICILKAEGWPIPALLGEFNEWLEERGFTVNGDTVSL